MKLLEDAKNLPVAELRSFIALLEETALQKGERVEIPITHHFSKNVYAREMKMPAGALIIGKIHKEENLNILSEGEVSVLSQDGLFRAKAPHTFVGTPGSKRVIYAHTPVTWTTIHGTSETDLDKIETQFIAQTYEEITEDLCLGSSSESAEPVSLLEA